MWSVHDDQCGSDHYVIVLNATIAVPVTKSQKFKLAKADWSSFGLSRSANWELGHASLDTAAHPVQALPVTLMKIAKEAIAVTSVTVGVVHKPCFNEDCKTAIRDRNQALRQYSTSANLNNTRIFRAKA
jgi:hypothetical protein